MLKRITKSAFAKMVAARKRRNKAFERMTPAQKRVTIAKDVLESLGAKKIVAKHFRYFSSDELSSKEQNAIVGKDLADVLPLMPSCGVCAVGSLFTCAVQRADDLKIVESEYSNGSQVGITDGGFLDPDARGYLLSKRLFTRMQLMQMENAFESRTITGTYNPEAFPFRTVVDGWRNVEHGTADERLRLIMENVVRNKGTFKLKEAEFLEAAKKLPIVRPRTTCGSWTGTT